MTSEHLEIEQKFDVPADAAWVDLGAVAGVHLGKPAEHQLDATYFDTDGFALARAGVTLRRRTGGSDAGWHLKLPSGSGDRTEHGEPLGDADAVPVSLLDLVRAQVRDHAVRPVATLSTRRTVHTLLGDADLVLAEAADDAVTAQAHGDGSATISNWREWEIELVDGPSELIDEVGAVMRAAGATSSPWSSKLQRALGDRVAPRPTFSELSPGSPARDVVQAHFLEQVEAVLTRDPQARRDEPDGVHKMRVATRRLRSALATFRPLLERELTDPIRDELKWIAGELGGARDAEVLRMRLLETVAAEPDDLVLGPIAARIEAELQSDHRKAHDALVEALNSERYFRLLDRLDALVDQPPFTEPAEGRADQVLTGRVRKAYRKIKDLVDAGEPEPGEHCDEWFHEIRKSAKRLRYAAESVEPAFGDPADALAKAAENLQEVLGEHQDSVVARAALRELGVRIHLDGENAFTIGRLHALEQAKADAAEKAFAAAWAGVADKKVRSWIRK